MATKVMTIRNFIAAGLAVLMTAIGLSCYVAGKQSTLDDRDALRATVTAMREGGDGSCAVKNDGPHVVCWMEGGVIKLVMAPKQIDRCPPAKRIRVRRTQ